MNILVFTAIVAICVVIALMVLLFGFGLMHGHLKNRGEAFGDAPTKTDLERIERKLDAALAANDPRPKHW